MASHSELGNRCSQQSRRLSFFAQPSRFMSGPLPSSAGLQCGHSSRLETLVPGIAIENPYHHQNPITSILTRPQKSLRSLSQTIVAQNGGDRPASTESWPGVSKATHAGQSGMAATCGNGNVDLDKLLNDDSKRPPLQTVHLSTCTYPSMLHGPWAIKSVTWAIKICFLENVCLTNICGSVVLGRGPLLWQTFTMAAPHYGRPKSKLQIAEQLNHKEGNSKMPPHITKPQIPSMASLICPSE